MMDGGGMAQVRASSDQQHFATNDDVDQAHERTHQLRGKPRIYER